MVKVTPLIKSLIIQKYLYRQSLSEISRETGVSKTMVHYITKEWISRVSVPDLEELRRFLYEINKSGITILECVQGFRTAQILKQFDIKDNEFDDWMDDSDNTEETDNTRIAGKDDAFKANPLHNKSISNNNIAKASYSSRPSVKRSEENNSKGNDNQITRFINTIYKNCKDNGIKPATVIRWMEDLLSFYSISNNNTSIDKYDNSMRDLLDYPAEERFQKNDFNEQLNKEIPIVSRISYYIEQKKKKIEHLQDSMISISKEINDIEKEKQIKRTELNQVIEKERKAFFYFKWYSNLKRDLLYGHNLLIEQEFGTFAASINDFKQYEFDATKILTEYKSIDSLRKERDHIQFEISQNTAQRDKLLNENSYLEEQRTQRSQIINAYQQLDNEGFRLREFKHLINLIHESALENGIEIKDSIEKFLRDVEDHYDNKLGFEKKINELKTEMEKLKDEVPEYRWYLQLQGIVSPTLIFLNNSGVTSEDIIGMNHLVLEFKNSDFLSDPIEQNDYNSGIKTNDTIVTRTQYWLLFVQKLKELKNINAEIKKQNSILSYLKKQISDLIASRQKIENAYADSVSNLNQVITKTHQFHHSRARQINEPITSKNILPMLILFPILVDSNSHHNDDSANENKNSK